MFNSISSILCKLVTMFIYSVMVSGVLCKVNTKSLTVVMASGKRRATRRVKEVASHNIASLRKVKACAGDGEGILLYTYSGSRTCLIGGTICRMSSSTFMVFARADRILKRKFGRDLSRLWVG